MRNKDEQQYLWTIAILVLVLLVGLTCVVHKYSEAKVYSIQQTIEENFEKMGGFNGYE